MLFLPHDDVHDDITEESHENNGVILQKAGMETNTGDITGVTDGMMDGTNDPHDIAGVMRDTVNNTKKRRRHI